MNRMQLSQLGGEHAEFDYKLGYIVKFIEMHNIKKEMLDFLVDISKDYITWQESQSTKGSGVK